MLIALPGFSHTIMMIATVACSACHLSCCGGYAASSASFLPPFSGCCCPVSHIALRGACVLRLRDATCGESETKGRSL